MQFASMTLDQFLTEKGISTPAFAKAIGMNASSLWRIRNGKVRPDWNTVEAIVTATGGSVSADDFLTSREPPLDRPFAASGAAS